MILFLIYITLVIWSAVRHKNISEDEVRQIMDLIAVMISNENIDIGLKLKELENLLNEFYTKEQVKQIMDLIANIISNENSNILEQELGLKQSKLKQLENILYEYNKTIAFNELMKYIYMNLIIVYILNLDSELVIAIRDLIKGYTNDLINPPKKKIIDPNPLNIEIFKDIISKKKD